MTYQMENGLSFCCRPAQNCLMNINKLFDFIRKHFIWRVCSLMYFFISHRAPHVTKHSKMHATGVCVGVLQRFGRFSWSPCKECQLYNFIPNRYLLHTKVIERVMDTFLPRVSSESAACTKDHKLYLSTSVNLTDIIFSPLNLFHPWQVVVCLWRPFLS